MVVNLKLGLLILLTALIPQTINAGVYLGLAPTHIIIKTNAGSTKPLTTDIRVGYALDAHKIELAILTSNNDDSLSQLVTDVPGATSFLYRYTSNLKDSLHIDLILGYSQIDITSSYVLTPVFTETFRGVSFGIGLEESLKSIQQLKFKIDYIQLYRGDNLHINALTIGVRYAF